MKSSTSVLESFSGKTRKLAPLGWFCIAVGHFPTIVSGLVDSRPWKIILGLYCAFVAIISASHVLLSTYVNFSHTGSATMSIVLLLNHFCHMCTSFVAPWLTWLWWKDWQAITGQLSYSQRFPKTDKNRKNVLRLVIVAFVLNVFWVVWAGLLYFHSNIMNASDTRIWNTISRNSSLFFAILESFTDSVVPLQFCVCCRLIQGQYEQTKLYMEEKIQAATKKELANFEYTLDYSRKLMLNTWKCVENVNTYFGLPLLITLSAKFLRGTVCVYGFIRLFLLKSSVSLSSYLWNFLYMSLDLTTIIVILWAAESVSESFVRLSRTVREISTLTLDATSLSHFNCFLGQLKYLQVELNAASFFSLGKRLCPSVVSAIATYLFVLMQFDLGDSNKCPIKSNNTG